MSQLRVLLGFTNAPDHILEETTGAVIQHLYGNVAFPSPPVPTATLQSALTAFTASIAAQAAGGPPTTANKNNKRDALIALLRQLAGYVQQNCNNNMAMLLSSGFDAVSTNRAQSDLPAPAIRAIDNGMSGQILVRVTPVANAKAYEVRFALIAPGGAPGPWQNGGLFTNSRSMPINNLTPGTNYNFQVRAIGGKHGLLGLVRCGEPYQPVRGLFRTQAISIIQKQNKQPQTPDYENQIPILNCRARARRYPRHYI